MQTAAKHNSVRLIRIIVVVPEQHFSRLSRFEFEAPYRVCLHPRYHLHMKFDDGGRLTVAFLFALTVIIMYNKL